MAVANTRIHYFPLVSFSSSSRCLFYTNLLFNSHKSFKPLQNPLISSTVCCQLINHPNSSNGDNSIKEEEEARDAVRNYLQQVGCLSAEDASLISTNCPNYIKSLIDAVNDLDDWNSQSDIIVVDFNKKVYEMASQKGDKGVIPYLESLGFPLSSASYLARYLSSSSSPSTAFLPLLIRKVKYVKDVLFSDTDDSGIIIAKNALRMMGDLSISADEDLQQTLAFFEKVGLCDNDIGNMLVKYPWILSDSMLENFEKIVDFLDEEKVPRICSSKAIKNWPHILGCSIDKVKLMVKKFGEIGISDKKLGRIIAKSPQLLLRKPQEFVQMVNFFKGLGLDDEAIARTLARCPEIFGASIDKTLEKKVEFLSLVGIAKAHLPRVIRKYPDLFVCDVDKALLPRVRYLMKIGLSKNEIGSMVRRFSPLLGYSIEEVLRPKIEFLVNTMERPVKEVVDYPRYFSYSLEKKIKPRYWVMKSRNIEFHLKEMLGKNDDEFADLYLGLE